MTLSDLSAMLVQEGIPNNRYSLKGGLPSDSLCIDKEEKWIVYYSDRGHRYQLMKFETEDAACRYLYTELIKDKEKMRVRGQWRQGRTQTKEP